ncbi:MAG TPA: hypothetical protein VG936_12400 [Lacunisphaera sp.]|nr:hypothetical protein [Lacunisphaera sp.]
MSRRHFLPCLLAVLGFALGLAGCASYDAQVVSMKSVKGINRFFVVTNQNDNHAIAENIASVLKARGFAVDVGPRTMMPDNTQAVVLYQDRWTWDFGDHLIYLTINIRDALTGDPLTGVTYSVSIPPREALGTTIGRLVDRLLAGK